MMDEQWAREHIGITPAVDETTEGVAMFALQIRRAMAEEHISVTLPQNWVIPVLADRDRIEAENAELRAQLEAQVARGGAVVVPESDRPTPEFVENYVEGFDPGERSAALFGWREGRADLRKSIQPIPASQVLQPGMVQVDREELMYLHAFEKYARKHGPESIQGIIRTAGSTVLNAWGSSLPAERSQSAGSAPSKRREGTMFAENVRLTERLASHGFRHEDNGNRWVGGIHKIIRIDTGDVVDEMDCYEASAFCKGIEFGRANP